MEEVSQRQFEDFIFARYRDTTFDKENTQFEASPDEYCYTGADYVCPTL